MTRSYPPDWPLVFMNEHLRSMEWEEGITESFRREGRGVTHCDSPLLWITMLYRWLTPPLGALKGCYSCCSGLSRGFLIHSLLYCDTWNVFKTKMRSCLGMSHTGKLLLLNADPLVASEWDPPLWVLVWREHTNWLVFWFGLQEKEEKASKESSEEEEDEEEDQ